MIANQLQLIPIDPLDRDLTIAEARVYCAVAVTGAIVRVAVYQSVSKGFVKVAGTDVTLSLASTGKVSATLSPSVTLIAGERYWIGCNISDASASISYSLAKSPIPTLTCTATATSACPSGLDLQGMTNNYVAAIPVVYFVSQGFLNQVEA